MQRAVCFLILMAGVRLLQAAGPACTNNLDCQRALYARCSGGTCRQCVQHSDCYNGAPWAQCELGSNGDNFCTVSCTTDSECDSRLPNGGTRHGLQYCTTTPGNPYPICRFCKSTSDCLIGVPLSCQVADSSFCQQCFGDSDCKAGQRCYLSMCSDCLRDGDCAANPDGKYCVRYIKCGCFADSDCTIGVRNKCYNQICRQCLSNADCTSVEASVCDLTTTFVCKACTMHSHCSHISNAKKCHSGLSKCVQCLADSDCTGSVPKCDLATYTCKSCLSDSECALATAAQCTAGTCSGCTSDAACAHTVTNLICQAGNCVQCLSNSDCNFNPTSTKCNTASNTCVTCLTSNDCPTLNYPTCSSSGTCVGCTSNSDCMRFPSSSTCLLSQSRCVACETSANCPLASASVCTTGYTCEGCAYDYQCSHITGKQYCKTSSQTCVECLSHSQCTGGKVCDLTTNTCVACTSNLNCTFATSSKCSAGLCTGCTLNSDCTQIAGNPVCLTSLNKCVNCLASSDCKNSSASECVSNICVGCTSSSSCTHLSQTPFCYLATNRCVQCFVDTDCTSVTAPLCSGNACQKCNSDDVCSRFTRTPYCNFNNGMCVRCFTDSHCSGATNKCDVYTGNCVVCASNYDCTSKALSFCGPQKTCQPCTSNEGCAHLQGTQTCRESDGVCVQCLKDSDCWGKTPFCNTTSQLCVSTLVVITGEEGCTPLVKGSLGLINFAQVHTVIPLLVAGVLEIGSSVLLRVILDQQIYYFATFLNSPTALYTSCLMKRGATFPFSFNTNLNFLNFSSYSDNSTASSINATSSSNSTSVSVSASSSIFDMYNITSKYPENAGGEISLLLVLVGVTFGIWIGASIIKKAKKEKLTHRYPIEVFFRWNLVLTVLLTDQSDLFFAFLRQITGNHSNNPSGAFDYGLSATGALALVFSFVFTIYQSVYMRRSVEDDHDDERLEKYFWGVVLMDDYKHSKKLEFFYIPIMILRNALVAALVVVAEGSHMFQSVCLVLIMTLSIAYMIRVKPLKNKRDLILQTLIQFFILIDATSKIAMAATDPKKESSKLDSISLIPIITSYGVVGCAMVLMSIRMLKLGLFLGEKLRPLCRRRREKVVPDESFKKSRSHIIDGFESEIGNSYITPASNTNMGDESPSKAMQTRSRLSSKTIDLLTSNADTRSPTPELDTLKISRSLSRAISRGTIIRDVDAPSENAPDSARSKGGDSPTLSRKGRTSTALMELSEMPVIEDLDAAEGTIRSSARRSTFHRRLLQRGTINRLSFDLDQEAQSQQDGSPVVLSGIQRRLRKDSTIIL